MTHRRTYTYSQLSAESARELVALHYDSVEPVSCKFYVLGLHDNYLVQGRDSRYILRIYRNEWRSAEAIAFELQLLAYLQERKAPVAGPVPTTDGKMAWSIDGPEGTRMAALFQFADGCAPEEAITTEQCAMLGGAVAQVHALSDTFSTKHQRPELDIQHLVDDAIEAIKPFVDAHDSVYMYCLRERLHRTWPKLRKEAGIFGICIGDVNPKNFHVSASSNITLFDFDQCGFGYRAFEIGKFSASLRAHRQKQKLMKTFLRAYQERRRLSRAEYAAIPFFELVAVLWVMSIYAMNVNRIGYKYLEKPFWDRKFDMLRELEAQNVGRTDAAKRRR